MSESKSIDADDAQTTKQLRFEVTVRFGRALDHTLDDPARLRQRLSLIPVDCQVSVAEFTDTMCRMIVEADPAEMGHSVELLAKKARAAVRSYNQHVISPDDPSDIPTGSRVKAKLVRYAAEGKTADDYPGYVSPEDWQKAKELAADLDLDGAPALEPDITLRTISGDYDPANTERSE